MHVTFVMSLDTFFMHPGSSKRMRQERRKEARANANVSQRDELAPEDDAAFGTEPADNEALNEQRDKLIVECITANRRCWTVNWLT